MSFVHPWGLLALLAIPGIVALHCLRHRRQRFIAPALFLLPAQAVSSLAGPRLEAFRRSLPLWLQLLAALLFTWLIAQPRWDSAHAVPRVVVVLDSSASMQASAARVREMLPGWLTKSAAAQTPEILLLSSDLGEGQLHRSQPSQPIAAQETALREALDAWQPWSDAVDLPASLEIARALAGPEGALVLVTDHDPGALPFAAQLALVGEPAANAGFVGVRFVPASPESPAQFEVLLRNYGNQPQTRTWQLVSGPAARAQPLAQGEVPLPANGLVTLRVPAPAPDSSPASASAAEENQPLRLSLNPDPFPADDALPLLLPQPKSLRLARGGPAPWPPWLQRFLTLLPATEFVPDPANADLLFGPWDSTTPPATSGPARLSWAAAPAAPARLDQPVDQAAADPASLISGLDFGGLAPVAPDPPSFPAAPPPAAEILAWSGPRPLIVHRPAPASPWLHLDFDLAQGRVEQNPALPVLLARFAESVRAGLPRSSASLRGTAERLADPPPGIVTADFQPLDADSSAPASRSAAPLIPAAIGLQGLALPRQPGWLTLTSDQPDGLSGQPVTTRLALHFAHFAEADLRPNTSAPLPDLQPAPQTQSQNQNPTQPWLIAALLGLLLITWWAEGR